jgi:SAM-dependent methyltransferase
LASIRRFRSVLRRLPAALGRRLKPRVLGQEIDDIYAALYELAHDVDRAAPFAARRTVAAFGHQWASLPSGKFMLSDPVFKREVDQIISTQEILLRADWFKGKRVLDAGCGGGRWSYGLAKLGADVTAVDANASAVAATRQALEEVGGPMRVLQSELESVDQKLPHGSFDLVWSWGVLHHCVSFTGALAALARLLKPGGVLFLYLYGRESLGFADDVLLFKERLHYAYLQSQAERERFLAAKAAAIGVDVHHAHDIFAPLINRRFEFAEIEQLLTGLGFTAIERTIDHTELWVRAVLGPDDAVVRQYGLPKKTPPYWFQRA